MILNEKNYIKKKIENKFVRDKKHRKDRSRSRDKKGNSSVNFIIYIWIINKIN